MIAFSIGTIDDEGKLGHVYHCFNIVTGFKLLSLPEELRFKSFDELVDRR